MDLNYKLFGEIFVLKKTKKNKTNFYVNLVI